MKKLLLITIPMFIIISPVFAQNKSNTESILKRIIEGEPSAGEKKNVTADKNTPPRNTKDGTDEKKQENKQAIPAPDEILLKTGIQLYTANLTDAAKEKFSELKKKFPQSPFKDQASTWIGRIYLEKNDPNKAIKEFSAIGEESGEYPISLYYVGAAYHKSGNTARALSYFYKISSQFPEHERADDALLFIASIYQKAKKGNHALEAAIKIIRQYPERETVDDAYYLLGKVYEKDPVLRDFEIARKIYKIFLTKASKEKNSPFSNSPLRPRVERDLRYIEATYFKMEY